MGRVRQKVVIEIMPACHAARVMALECMLCQPKGGQQAVTCSLQANLQDTAK
jgi:hypothetical protein